MKISVIGLRGFPMVEGGVEKHCEMIYPLIAQHNEVTVYRRKAYVNSEVRYKNITFIDFPSTKIKGFETIFYSLLATIDAFIKKPDIVHYHNIGPAVFSPILKFRKIPIVLTFHSANYEHKKWGVFAKNFLKLSEKIALNNADRIIFVNKFQMYKYSQKFVDKSLFIPNGINKIIKTEKTDFLKKIGVDAGKYILSVGRITPEKGFDLLIKSYYNADITDMKLVIAGSVEFESKYMQYLKSLCKNDDVIFTGYTYGEDLSQLYTHASLFVLASRSEGFPLVLLEAMTQNLDVVVSDIPATHLVKLNKEDYFSVDNEKELSDSIKNKISIRQKRNYDLTDFDWEKISIDTMKVYNDIYLGGI